MSKADGSIGYTVANYVPDVDDSGRVAGFSVLVSDVTPLKLAEFQTARTQARLRAVLDSVADGIVTFDGRMTISSINPAAVRMFGYQADELLGRSLQLRMSSQLVGIDPAMPATTQPIAHTTFRPKAFSSWLMRNCTPPS